MNSNIEVEGLSSLSCFSRAKCKQISLLKTEKVQLHNKATYGQSPIKSESAFSLYNKKEISLLTRRTRLT